MASWAWLRSGEVVAGTGPSPSRHLAEVRETQLSLNDAMGSRREGRGDPGRG